MEKYQHYINGKWTDGSSKETIVVVNPANGKDIGEVVCANQADVNAAVEAASNAYQSRILVDMLPMGEQS
jgi:acyl-CoA reductase-like NAD-dependent aldehyde dehydrogenase